MSSLRAQILLCYKEILMIGAQTGIYSTHRAKLMIDCQTLYLKVTFNLYQIINEPTRYFSNQPTILDLIITDSLHLLLGSGVTPPPPPHSIAKIDHCTVYCKLNVQTYLAKSYKRTVWDSKTENIDALMIP